MNETLINMIIGVIPLLCTVPQILNLKKNKYFDYPFAEYIDFEKENIAKITNVLWRATFFLLFSIFIVSLILARLHIGTEILTRNDFKVLYIICLITVNINTCIKDLFHNKFQFKEWFIKRYKKTFNNMTFVVGFTQAIAIAIAIDSLMIVIFIYHNNIAWKSLYILLIVFLEAAFNVYRIVNEACELNNLVRVKQLLVRTIDGSIYEAIRYKDNGKSIGIDIEESKRLYVEKTNILVIEKELGNRAIIDYVKEKTRSKEIRKKQDN